MFCSSDLIMVNGRRQDYDTSLQEITSHILIDFLTMRNRLI
jgi:hypothetical protein